MATTTGPDPAVFTPTLTDVKRQDRPPGQRPWRLGSQFYLAFFGGILPLAWIAYQNSGRLGMPRRERTRLAIAGGLGSLFVLVLAVFLIFNQPLLQAWFPDTRPTQVTRLLFRACAVLLYLPLAAWQKSSDRRYAVFQGGQYDSLWRPGFIAAVVGDLILLAIFLPILFLLA